MYGCTLIVAFGMVVVSAVVSVGTAHILGYLGPDGNTVASVVTGAAIGVVCGVIGGRIIARIVFAEWERQERDALRKRTDGGHHEGRNH